LRFLPVVNKYNQVVGTITRSDLTADALAETMLQKGKKHEVGLVLSFDLI
jgi:CBS-domain-containing membrane protein